jgi:hypothetical protein
MTTPKTYFFIILLIFSIGETLAQDLLPIRFSQSSINLGRIKEWEGPVKMDFNFINQSDSIISIENVINDCGCTSSGYSREGIRPNERGIISITYDPQNRPGPFTRVIQVVLIGMKEPVILSFDGYVLPSVKDLERDFPVENGSLRFRTKFVNMGNFTTNDTLQKVVDVYNQSSDVIHLVGVENPNPHLRVIFNPDTLLPNQWTEFIVEYLAPQKGDVGYYLDTLKLLTSDFRRPRKDLIVSASIEEYFPPMTKEQLDNSAALAVSDASLDFGNVNKGAKPQKELTIRNIGKSDLIIRKIISNCSCIEIMDPPQSIRPGQEYKLKLKFDTEGRIGTEYKTLTIFSNDPRIPTRQVVLRVLVRD